MRDGYNREINYLRISVTGRCMMNCFYCNPKGADASCVDVGEELSAEEIGRLAAVFCDLGIEHIRLTGGEPLLRKDLTDVIRLIRRNSSLKSLTLTTNGLLLAERLAEITEAGLTGVNISLDTVDPERFLNITGTDRLQTVMDSIYAAVKSDIAVKINAVSLEREIDAYCSLIDRFADLPVDIRFIELMPIGAGGKMEGLSHEKLLPMLMSHYPGLTEDRSRHGNGPAVYFRIPGRAGSVGLISAASRKFCPSCNRIRLTADGYLKPCLCYDAGVTLRPIIADPVLLRQTIAGQIAAKPKEHCFTEPERITEKRRMSKIGG